MASPSEVPPIPTALVEWLESLFPDTCPRPDDSDREIWMRVGAVRLVRKVRAEFNAQNQTVIT